ncbi:hypothetical protein WAI453_005847 [Rhynchosporium graminicola]
MDASSTVEMPGGRDNLYWKSNPDVTDFRAALCHSIASDFVGDDLFRPFHSFSYPPAGNWSVERRQRFGIHCQFLDREPIARHNRYARFCGDNDREQEALLDNVLNVP